MRYRIHIKETLWLSAPLIVTQVGHIITGMTDTAFLGRVNLESQDAGILSGNVFILLLVFLIGMCQGLTPKIADLHVNGKEKEKAFLLKNSLLLNLLNAVMLYVLIICGMQLLSYFDQPQDVVELAKPFLNIIALSLIPLAVFFTFKQYCEGLSNTRAAMYISISSNILNVILNYGLIFGKLGMPEIGYLGAAWATFISRVFMAVAFFIYLKMRPELKTVFAYWKDVRIEKRGMNTLFKIGIGPAVQYTFEVAAFTVAGFMSGWLGKETFASHGVALHIASFTYMFASGISGASSIRVANFNGLSDRDNVKKAGISGFLIVAGIMTVFGITFLLFNYTFTSIFSKIPSVIDLSAKLLLVAALFQLFDGVQCVGLGILRGLSDVKIPTILALTAYWLVALPLAYLSAYKLNFGVFGIWAGLSAGLIFAAVAFVARFRYLVNRN